MANNWGEMALALLYPQGYNALSKYRENQKIEEAAPFTNQLQDWRNRGWGSDPSYSGSEWTKGLMDLEGVKPDTTNPIVQKSILDFANQAQKESDISRLVSGEGDPSALARVVAGDSGQHINAIRQAKDAFIPGVDTQTPADRQFIIDSSMAASSATNPNDLLAKITEAANKNQPSVKTLHDTIQQLTGPNFFAADKSGANQTDQQLIARSLKGDKEATAILDALYKRKGDLARQNRTIIQQTPTRNITVNGLTADENAALARAIDNGLDPYKVNSRTAKIYAQQEMMQPGRKWNELGAQAAFERSQSTMNTKALLNTIDPLLSKLEQAGAVLGNSSLPGYNKALNFLKEQTGSSDIVGFNNLRDDVVAEVERGLLGTGVLSDSKYNRAIKNINSAQSLPQLKAAIKNTRTVIEARLESLAKGPNSQARNNKQLDANTARQFLQKAGGDKAKARQMARDAGYNF